MRLQRSHLRCDHVKRPSQPHQLFQRSASWQAGLIRAARKLPPSISCMATISRCPCIVAQKRGSRIGCSAMHSDRCAGMSMLACNSHKAGGAAHLHSHSVDGHNPWVHAALQQRDLAPKGLGLHALLHTKHLRCQRREDQE